MGPVGDGQEDEDYTPLVPQVRVRVLVECHTVEQFVVEYHRFVDGDRIFIATDVTETVGNLVQFRVDLSDGRAVLHGTGTVLQVRPAHDGLPRGMVLQFIALDENSVIIVDSMSRRRARMTPAEGVLSMEAPPAQAGEAVPRVVTPLPDSQMETRTFPRVDSTARFRLRDGAPDARRTWRTKSVERKVVPANPFSDVPDVALAYFVDWAIERNASTSAAAPATVAFHDVRMEAPRRRQVKPPTWAAFAVGLGIGCAGIVSAFDLFHDVAGLARKQEAGVAREVLVFPPDVARDSTAKAPPQVGRDAPAKAPIVAHDAPPIVAHDTPPIVAHDAPPIVAHDIKPKPASMAPATPSKSIVQEPSKLAGLRDSDGKMVSLAVAADPGASVFLDGQRVGRTPLVLKVARGAHTVELQRPRYQTVHLDVDAPGRTSAHLERPRATLHVTSNLPDAEVFVDGEAVGHTPVSAEVAGYERSTVEVRVGWRLWKKKLYVKPPLTDVAATFSVE